MIDDEHHEAAGAMWHRGLVEQRLHDAEKAERERREEIEALRAELAARDALLREARRVVSLANELCDSVDADVEDVGGARGSLVIIRDIGPLVAPLIYDIDAALTKGGGDERNSK